MSLNTSFQVKQTTCGEYDLGLYAKGQAVLNVQGLGPMSRSTEMLFLEHEFHTECLQPIFYYDLGSYAQDKGDVCISRSRHFF